MHELTSRQEQLLDQFDDLWQRGQWPSIDEFMRREQQDSDGDPVTQRQFLAELIKIDLECRWRRRQSIAAADAAESSPAEQEARGDVTAFVEDYQSRYPELDADPELLAQLVLEECRARRLWGDDPGADEYMRRYPHLQERLQPDLADVQRQLEIESSSQALRSATNPNALDGTRPSARSPVADTGPDPDAKHFGGYELLEEIARGGMGIVFKARQIDANRIVALKVILAGKLASEEDLIRFRHEVETVANLDHPGIVPVYEVGVEQGQHFFSMSYIEGPTLSQVLKDGPLAPRRAAEIMRDVAEAIAFAHDSGVIHRDIKPANILLQHNRTPTVTDFGLARNLGRGEALTQTGDVLGTPSYMPPEQALGRQVNVRADVYSLGAVLYELLVARPPFRSETVLETLNQVVRQEPVPPRPLNPAVPRDLETICLKCLEKEPAARYVSARALAEDLQRFLNGEPTLARPVSVLTRYFRWCRRNKLTALLSHAAMLLVLLVLAVTWMLYVNSEQTIRLVTQSFAKERRLREEAEMARQELEVALLQKDRTRYLSEVRLIHQAWEEDPRQNAVAARTALRRLPQVLRNYDRVTGWEWYFLDHLYQSEDRSFGTGEGTIYDCDAARNGTFLFMAGSAAVLQVWSAQTGELLQSCAGHRGAIRSVDVNESGTRAVTASDDGTVRLWDFSGDLRTSTGRVLVSHGDVGVNAARFLDNGETVIIGDEAGVIAVYREDMGLVCEDRSSTARIRQVRVAPRGAAVAVADSRGQLRVWKNELPLADSVSIAAHEGGAFDLAWSPDGNTLASCAADRRIRFWNPIDGSPQQDEIETEGRVFGICYLDDARLAAVGDEGTCQIWDLSKPEILYWLSGHSRSVLRAMFAPVANRLSTAGRDGVARLWDVTTLGIWQRIELHQGPVTCCEPVPNSARIVTGGRDGRARLFDLVTSSTLADVIVAAETGDTGIPVRSLSVSPDGRLCAIACDRVLALWDLETNEVNRWEASAADVCQIGFSADSRLLITGSVDGQLEAWTVESRSAVNSYQLPTAVRRLSVSMLRTTVCSVDDDGRVGLWDYRQSGADAFVLIETPNDAAVLQAQPGLGVFGPDDQRLFVADRSGGLETYRRRPFAGGEAFEREQELERLSDRITDLDFSPRSVGPRLITGTADGIVQIWDAMSLEKSLTLDNDIGINAITFSADGTRIVSGNPDGSISVWTAPGMPE